MDLTLNAMMQSRLNEHSLINLRLGIVDLQRSTYQLLKIAYPDQRKLWCHRELYQTEISFSAGPLNSAEWQPLGQWNSVKVLPKRMLDQFVRDILCQITINKAKPAARGPNDDK